MRLSKHVDLYGPVHPELGTACWLYTGKLDKGGYGRFMRGGKRLLVHRFVMGDPENAEVDHRCHVRNCIRRSHLQIVPLGFNAQQGGEIAGAKRGAQMAIKTHCPNGHAYAGFNLLVIASRPKARYCRICNRERAAAWRAARRDT